MLIVVAVLMLGFVVPTGASSGDHLWADPNVVVAPGSGPGGEYASINGDGELEVDLSTTGVNAGAVTVVDGVFRVSNEDADTVAIWFSHDEPDDVVLSVDGRSAQLESDPIVLAPGARVAVDLAVDSSTRSAGEQILSSFTIHAENATDDGSSSGGGGTAETRTTSGSASMQGSGDDESSEPPVELPPPSGEDEVFYADGVEPDATFIPLDPASVVDLDDRTAVDGPPAPIIDGELSPRTLAANGSLRSAAGTDAVVDVGEDVSLSADRTVFDTASAIQPDGSPARLVDIKVPADRAHDPAIVRLAVDRERLASADPAAARIGRHTPSGWQLLATSVVEADDERVVLEAMTSGVGTFAVFQAPAVNYHWRLAPDRTADTTVVTTRFETPGRHSVTLAVTDGFGRTATTEYRVLANDRPSVAIEAPPDITPGEPVVLRANVTNEVGAVSVTWQFADGTMATGTAVKRSFAGGEQPVRVVVSDEYGAEASATTTLVVGDAARVSRAAIELVQLGLNIEQRLAFAAGAILLLIIGLRKWAATRPRRTRERRVR